MCLLFALVISTNCWADVTAEWGEWGCGTSDCYFPSGYSEINGIRFTEELESCPHSGFYYGPNGPRKSECFIYPGEYAYITIPSGYTIKNISASVYNNPLKIQFCSTTSYDENNVIETKSLSNSGTSSEAVLSSTNAPTEAKSARLFSEAEVVLIRFIVTIQSEDCPKLTASFSTGTGSGTAPDNIEKCEGAGFTMPGKGSMTKAGYALIGWKKDNAGDLIAVGQNYTMPAGGVSFTAQWEEIPAVSMPADSVKVHGTDFEVSWVIPGICDLRNYIDPYNNGSKISDQATDDSDVLSYADGIITCAGDAEGCGQHGVAFPIVPTTDVTSITIDCKGNTGFPSTHTIWGGVINSSSTYTYWDYASDLHEYRPADFGTTYNSRRTFDIDTRYWSDGDYNTSISIDYIAVFGNAGCSSPGYNSFSVREARYHVAGRPDIDHVVLMRTKANSDPALTDTTETSVTKRVYSGIKSYYYDEDEKEEGTTYYYTIFAVHADGTLSSGTVVGKSTAEAEKFAVTYDVNGASGDDVPASASYTAGRTFTLPLQGDLHKSGHKFGGWNDGSTTTAAGASYTMPDPGAPVSFTAVWNEFSVPTISNLAITNAANSVIPLSWDIPGICDLSRVVSAYGISDQFKGSLTTSVTDLYTPSDSTITAVGSANAYDQYGIAFSIPTTKDIETVTAKWKKNSGNIKLFASVINSTTQYTYWGMNDGFDTSDSWNTKTSTIDTKYWSDYAGGYDKSSTDIDYLGVFANDGGGSGYTNASFSLKELRYHIDGEEDIDHVVVMRKEGSASENLTDGTKIYSGTKSKFTDSEDKTPGATYYYTVFAVHADGTLSEAVSIQHEIEVVPTCTVSYENGGGTGEAPTDATEYATGHTVTLPSIGTVYKPFYAFTGWKKNNAGDLLAAGSTYPVTAEDVTAETISFTAQWVEDNTTRRIPAEHILNYSNQSTSVATTDYWDVTNDGINDVCLDMRQKTAEWKVFIKPGYYDISTICAVPTWGISYRLSIVDPVTDLQVKELFYEKTSGDDSHAIIRNLSKRFDLTDLAYGKQYIIRMKDTWPNCGLLVHDINFNPVTPEEIASETVLDANNTVTTGLTEVTDVDFPGDNDQSVNLYNKKMDWVVKINPGYYNISLQYGAPEYSTRVSVALIDPEGVEPTRWFCPDQSDRNGHYHYTSGAAGTQYYSIGLDKRDLYDIDPEKTYIVRVHDENGSSNSLRVKNLTFSPVAPIAISNVTDTRLDATHTIQAPVMATDLDIDDDSNVDNLMNLYNTNAEWLVTLQKGLYNVQLVYGAPGYSIKVAVKLIDPSGEEPDKVLSIEDNKDYYYKSNPAATEEAEATTPHHYTSATKCALLDVSEDKTYKVRVADVYPKCNLRVSHVLFTPIAPVEIHEEATLNASNVMVAPSIVDSRIDIRNQQEAVWYATIDPHKFDITLTYFAEEGGTKVRFAIIPVGGDTIFVHQENKYDASNTTYTIPALDQDLTNISSGVYKIIVKDNYKSNGSKPQIISLTFSRSVTTHTRTGLTVGNYGTICLPYAVAAEDRNGADLFEIDKWDPNGVSLTLSQLTNNENMVAGRPYIFQATEATATFRYYAEGDEAEAGSNNGLVGSYEQALIPQNDDNYIIYNNKLYLVNSEAYVGAYRAYIHKQDQVQPAPAYRRRVTLSVNGAQVATDIDLTNDPAQMTKYIENGHLFIFRDGKLYNAQGQLVK